MIDPLIASQQAQIDDGAAPIWHKRLKIAGIQARSEGLSVDAIEGQDDIGRPKPFAQFPRHVVARGDGNVGQAVDPAFAMGHKSVEKALGLEKGMGLELAGQAPLKIPHNGNPQQSPHHPADGSPFVQMAVDDVRSKAAGDAPRLEQEQGVDIDLVPRRTRRQLAVPG